VKYPLQFRAKWFWFSLLAVLCWGPGLFSPNSVRATSLPERCNSTTPWDRCPWPSPCFEAGVSVSRRTSAGFATLQQTASFLAWGILLSSRLIRAAATLR
jgi:hypothetical protein